VIRRSFHSSQRERFSYLPR